MIDLKYTITKFDNATKTVTVTFDDNSWAEVRLSNPLPKNIEELEAIIKQFAVPAEVIESQLNPDADLSFIDSLVGVEKTTTRYRLNSVAQENPTLDPETEANLKMWEDISFQKKVADALVVLGVLTENPTTIPVASV